MDQGKGCQLKFLGIIASRLDSSRLPGKALQKVHGTPLIQFVVQRVASVRGLEGFVLATTDRPTDDNLAEFAERAGVRCFRGETHDVAKRLLDCALEYEADYFVRINGDCVFLDPELIEAGIAVCRSRRPDLVTNIQLRSFPYGISVEIVRTRALFDVYEHFGGDDREHVTTWMYRNPSGFKIVNIHSGKPFSSAIRLVVDTQEDLWNFTRIVDDLGAAAATASYTEVLKAAMRVEGSNR
ncbi:MAG: NTP transferase domain-containing protein [Pirellulaceae bacterium]|nr:NTP transferase domain-containing protein [Pirellulaceae bacterium]